MQKLKDFIRRLLRFFLDDSLVVNIKFFHQDAKMPKLGREGDAAFDVSSCEDVTLYPLQPKAIICAIGCDIPSGYKIMVNGRSGLASKGIFSHTGTVDENYKGFIGPILVNLSRESYLIKKGDRVCQISLQKVIPTKFVEVAELSESNRGEAGFGSSGR